MNSEFGVFRMPLNLTYIPSKYWTKNHFFCQIRDNRPSPPSNSPFFVFWDDKIQEEAELNAAIENMFPEIPVKKLLNCDIHLVVHPHKLRIIQKEYYPISKVRAKIIPIPPMIKILFALPVSSQLARNQSKKNYSDSILTWAFLVKFTMEILSRGNFVPKLEKLSENHFKGQWILLLKGEKDYRRFNHIIKNSAWAGLNLPIDTIPVERLQQISPKIQLMNKSLEIPGDNENTEFKSHIQSNEPDTEIFRDFTNFTTGLWHPSYIFTEFINNIGDFLIRSFLQNGFYKKFAKSYQVQLNSDENACVLAEDSPWDLRFLDACIGKNREFIIERFCDTPIPNILRNWVHNAQGFPYNLGVNLTFRLEYPDTPDSEWDLGFYLQPLQDFSTFIPLMDVWEGIVTYQEEYKNVCNENNVLQEEILRALGIAAKLFPPISMALEGKNPHHVKIEAHYVMDFLRQGQYFLSQAGFNISLPEEFQQQGEQRLSARMVIKSVQKTQAYYSSDSPNLAPMGSGFDMESMLEFHWEAQLGKHGETLTKEEFTELAQSKEPLLYWRGKWVLIDPQDMESLRPIFEKQKTGTGEISYSEALKLGLTGGIQLRENGTEYEVLVEGDFSNVVSHLQEIDEFKEIPAPRNFQGELRPYQQTALTWLVHMAQLKFGVILADDMGLGKTVEVIAFLQHQKNTYPQMPGSILVVCPTSLLYNWKRELHKFAPDYEVVIHHGADRPKETEALKAYTIPYQIVLTTYGTIRNDINFLETIPFAGTILDESQNIKNFSTQQTQAVLKLNSRYRIALSGTPIENKLMELWTLFRFLNPGLLGPQKKFKTDYVTPIERFQDEQASHKLQKFIAPFLMRRLKSDKNIIKDLPEKNEIKQYLSLSPVQAKLYSQIVTQTMHELEHTEISQGHRRGLVLKLLTQTKQICNHPFQFWHFKAEEIQFQEGEEMESLLTSLENNHVMTDSTQINPDELDSASIESNNIKKISKRDFIHSSIKLQRLLEMIDEILEEGEKILIFTQFKQMGDLLKSILEEIFPFSVGWFHGGISAKQRQILVDNFQSKAFDSIPILILSLKAGGTGLNLTQASTVFHFDRWWNPAVEDQATDRAYRIGQEKTVNVYKFIATGTIEEKIDTMLESKRDLAESIIGTTGETWITELSNNELKELFSLNSEADF